MLNMRQKQALSSVVKNRYRRSNKKQKTKILNEFIKNTRYNRSYARRILGSLTVRRTDKRRRQKIIRKRIYDQSVFYPLRKVWIAADGICGKRLQPFLPELVRVLKRENELKITKKTETKLLTVSSATIDRMLKGVRRGYELKGRSTTKPGTLLRSTIPISMFSDWDEKRPGFFEADLVALCGESVRGEYINCLDMTDVATGWVGLEAFMGNAQSRVNPAVGKIRNRLPFSMLGIDSDNGTEFINWLLKRYCEKHEITFTRIRPYRKNDNCYVEQKNYTVVRRFLGYARYDTEEQLTIIKEILELVELYVNFFQPVMRLKKKKRIGTKVKKTYNIATTPYQKLLELGVLRDEQKVKLKLFYETLNPMEIKRKIHRLTEKLNKTLRYKINDATNT
jgi:hypothetical protein